MDEALEEISEAITAYESGDYTTALQQALPFATGGNPLAQTLVGHFFGEGLGVEKNSVEAFKWLRKAAEQGFAEAQFSVGHYYDLGDGVPVNKVRAYMWYSLAVAQGNEIAAPPLQYLDEHMSSSDISKAQELAIDWWEKHNN